MNKSADGFEIYDPIMRSAVLIIKYLKLILYLILLLQYICVIIYIYKSDI